jgi:hypothetical protein
MCIVNGASRKTDSQLCLISAFITDIRQTIKGRKKKKDKMKGKCGKQNMVGIGGVVAVLGTLGKESKDIF